MEVFGMMGFIFGLSALSKVNALEKTLKEAGVLEKNKWSRVGCYRRVF